MHDRLDNPLTRVGLAVLIGGVGAFMQYRFVPLPSETTQQFLGGLAGSAGSLGTAFLLTSPLMARDKQLRPLASPCAQAGTGWLITMTTAGVGYLLGSVFPGAGSFLALAALALGAMALRDALRVFFGIVATEEPK